MRCWDQGGGREERENSQDTLRGLGPENLGRMEQGHLEEDGVSGGGWDFSLGHAKCAVPSGHPRAGRLKDGLEPRAEAGLGIKMGARGGQNTGS